MKTKVLLLIVAVLLTSCTSPIYEKYHPYQHPGSKWVSEDEQAWFIINSDPKQSPHHRGGLVVNGEEISMVFEICMPWGGLSAVPKEEFDSVEFSLPSHYHEDDEPFARFREAWGKSEKREDWELVTLREEYIVCRIYASSVFEKGEEITFFRTL